ncbi:MAG TPA: hypothetical protein VF147_01390 [Vicinamibacterales bacterium]
MTGAARSAAGILGLVLVLAVPARAQAPDPPRASVTFGGGVANPLHGDLSYVAPAWQASVRLAPARHLLLDLAYGEWRHTTTTETRDVVFRGPTGAVLGHADRIIDHSEDVRPELTINFLGAWSSGRATFFAGGGPGYMAFRHRFTQTLEGCESATVSCAGYGNSRTTSTFSVQLVSGLDVTIASRIGAFGEFRLSVPVEDPGSGHTAVIGGVRIALF